MPALLSKVLASKSTFTKKLFILCSALLLTLLTQVGNVQAAEKDTSDFARIQQAAVQGQASAQVGLGFCYYFGHDVPQDYAQAVYWFQKAAEQWHKIAIEQERASRGE